MPDIFALSTESNSVKITQELIRVSKLPRRTWSAEETEEITVQLTDLLKTPEGTQSLRPLQALALCEIGTVGGLFGPMSVGVGKCVSGETEVFDITSGKRRRVDELGVFEVSTMNAEGKLTTAKTLASYSGQKACVRLVLKDGSSVVLSSDHPVYTARGWVCAGELSEEDDLVATARSIPSPKRKTEATDDEVSLAAYLLSDGSVSQSTTSFTNADECILKEVWEITERLADHKQNKGGGWKSEGVTRVSQKSRAYTFNLTGISWFRHKWGVHGLAKDKRLPAEFWGLPERQLGLFLNRFWACDGWVDTKGPAIVLASERMIDDLRFLLLRLGVHSRKSFKSSLCKGKRFDAWRLSVPTHSIESFFAKVGLIFSKEGQSQACLEYHRARERNTNVDVVPLRSLDVSRICDELGYQRRGGDSRKRDPGSPRTVVNKFFASSRGQHISRSKFEKFCQAGYGGRLSWLATSDVCWEKILRIEDVGIRNVFDLSVPGFGNFVGNNIVLHNTLVSLLAPVVKFSQRPLLIVPAKLLHKTEHDRAKLSKHWALPKFLRIMSYEWLGRAQAADALEAYKPDFVILDECHKVKNRHAAVSRRVIRFFQTHPEVQCVALSGTITKRSLFDYAHMLKWCLSPKKTPLPLRHADLELWADALDERKGNPGEVRRADPGALEIFCNEEEKKIWDHGDKRRAARSAYRRRLIETEGVIASYETPIDATLTLSAVEPAVSAKVEEAFEKLRRTWETPDGWPISDGLTMARHARELALGFFYVWDPRPPRHWLDARREWCAFVRKVLKHSHKLDSELQVRRAYPDDPLLKKWQAVAKDFEPNTKPVWLDTSVLEWCAAWAEENKGIVWTEHTCFGERLQEHGLTYYGKRGEDSMGRPIEAHEPGTPLVASIASNAEGRNLQAWSDNLITSFPPGGTLAEQLLGRTHRPGQEADEVSFDIVVTCAEHVGAFWQAWKDASYVQASTGAPQKLLLAGIDMPDADDIESRSGPRWNKKH